MLEVSGINYVAVLVVWLVYIAVGGFWYSPAGFAKQWAKLSGVDLLKMPKDKANQAIGFVAISAAIQAATLAIILNSLKATTAIHGLEIGLVLWFGLTAATTVGVTFYAQRSWKFLWLNSSYFLVVMSIGSIILAAWN